MSATLHRTPILLRAVVLGFLAAAAGTVPWALLVSASTASWPAP